MTAKHDYSAALEHVEMSIEDGRATIENMTAQIQKLEAIRASLRQSVELERIVPATPLLEGMTRDVVADVQRIIAELDRKKSQLAASHQGVKNGN